MHHQLSFSGTKCRPCLPYGRATYPHGGRPSRGEHGSPVTTLPQGLGGFIPGAGGLARTSAFVCPCILGFMGRAGAPQGPTFRFIAPPSAQRSPWAYPGGKSARDAKSCRPLGPACAHGATRVHAQVEKPSEKASTGQRGVPRRPGPDQLVSELPTRAQQAEARRGPAPAREGPHPAPTSHHPVGCC